MNRRTALMMTTLLGGLAPRTLLAQSRGPSGRSRRASADDARARRRDDEAARIESADADLPDDDPPPPDFPDEPGRRWFSKDISRYTGLPHAQNNPQTALIEWIFRRTESTVWHGDRVAVLCASRARLRAYHAPAELKKVAEIVERFTDAESDFLSVRVRFVAAADTRWRYHVNRALNPLGSGPQGQMIWSLKVEDAAMVFTQMQVYQGFKLIAERKFDMINGQTIFMESTVDRTYVAGLQREGGVGQGFQASARKLQEGVTLRLSPLLTYEGDALDAAVELKANTVKALHRTAVIAPREIGPSEMTIDVPEVAETRLNQTISGWPVGETLLISAGIQPGILQSKTGFLNLKIPGTYPTSTELLVFIDIQTLADPPRQSRVRD